MSGIVFGCIAPHPPLLVPQVGQGQEKAIETTIQAMERLARELAESQPQTLVVISPHGLSHPDAMGVATSRFCRGDFVSWGAPGLDFRYDNDLELVACLQEEAKALSVPLQAIGQRGYELDHGVLVPMYFLGRHLQGVPLIPLTFSWLPYPLHYAFGEAVSRAAERTGRRVGFIASGDLSHRLHPGAPAGYDPRGEVFDRKVAEIVAAGDAEALLGLDGALIEAAGECGLRSIIVLMGALKGLTFRSEVLSYEGPFGVGYLTAAFKVWARGTHPVVRLARETVEKFISEGKLPQLQEWGPEMKEKAGVFVSLKEHGELRGCIGTFLPAYPSVAEEIIENAISAATRDPRFPPVSEEELPHLAYSVDILTEPEPIESLEQLDPKRYGVIVECGGLKGLLLPDLEGVNTVEEQVQICCLKAGILPDEAKRIYRFRVRRFT